MSTTWTDLIDMQNPFLWEVDRSRVEGRDWVIKFLVTEDDRVTPVDISGVTWESKILTDLLDAAFPGAVVATFTVTGDSAGLLTLTIAAASTAGLGTGATKDAPRTYPWYLKGTKSSKQVQFWGPTGSTFRIYGE